MKPLLFRVFDGICAVAAEPAPVQDHLAFVYERCRIAGDSPPSVFFEFTGFPTGLCRVVADGEVLVRDEPLVSALLTLDLEILRRPLLLRPGLAGFHAAWVARGDVAFLLVGPGGCGKSTLAWELASRGFHYGSDEVAAFAAADGRLLPFPRKILLRPDNPLIPVRGIQQSPLNLFASLDGRYYTLPPGVAVAGPGVYEANFFFLQYAATNRG